MSVRSQHKALNLLLAMSAVVMGVATAGCGETSNTVSVNGHVSYRGQPLPNSSITFYPTSGRPANAPVAADGAYQVVLEPGDYTVSVTYSEPLPPGFKEGDPFPQPKIVLPPEYETRVKSALKATVSPNQSQPIDFKLQ